MIPSRRRGWFLGAALLAIVIALAVGIARTRSAAPAREKLAIAVSSTPHAALLHLAAAKNFFADEGLDVTLSPATHGKAAIEQLTLGQVELAAAAEVPFVIAVLQGQPLSVAATVASVGGEMALVARRDSGIAAPRDLLGKKIGATFGTSGEYFLWAFLIHHKLTPQAVTLVNLPPGQLAGELARGSIDAASTWQPVRLGSEVALGANAISFAEPDAYTVTHLVVGRSDFLRAHPGTAERLVRALLKAEALARAQPDEALRLVAQRLKIDPAAWQPGWQDLDFAVHLRQSQLVTLEDEARWAMARGHAPVGAVPNFLPHLYLDALLAAKPERVTVVR